MKNQITKFVLVVIVILVLAGLSYLLLFFVLTGNGTKFYKSCSQIKVGMSRDEVTEVMDSFNNPKFEFKNTDKSISYYTEGPMNDYQCNISFDESNKVEDVTKIFD